MISEAIKADASGAVILPAELCRAAGVAPGADLVAEVEGGRIMVQPIRLPVWQRIAARAAEIPAEEVAKLPADGAGQIDHYLYGHPRRPE